MKKLTSIILAAALALALRAPALAVTDKALDSAILKTAEYVHKIVKSPQVGSVGGEWAVMELARSGYAVPDSYYRDYYATVEEYVKACDGVLHTKKYTEYSRVTLALTAIGKDPSDVAGYDLLRPLGDYDKTIWQGLNGPIWALIALDTGDYPMPRNTAAKTQATRDMYVDRILECQLSDGGFSLFGGTSAAASGDGVSDPDITGMALQALAKYQDRADVKKATQEALAVMSKKQDSSGGFSSWGTTNSESVVQMIVALCELGIPLDDKRFVKNGKTLLDNLMTFAQPDGGFSHMSSGDGNNQMATEQALYGLIAAQRLRDGKPSLYRMTDALKISGSASAGPKRGEGLRGKSEAVQPVPISAPGKTFEDTYTHANLTAIDGLAARGIVGGKGDGKFHPDDTMTRAEYCAIMTRGLGIDISGGFSGPEPFRDVKPGDWHYNYVRVMYSYEIVQGSDGLFNPDGKITRQEAALMTARAAALCGIDTSLAPGEARDILAQFGDYVSADSWASDALSACYREGILSDTDMDIRPKEAITRGEVAQMLFDMLGAANLL
ncbi:MAG: S-layer homology domain-containing protein [Oscillospiraceae bacterium]|nr:S-layer homology domain-containing protein [Oscillospiraceae bacterium]